MEMKALNIRDLRRAIPTLTEWLSKVYSGQPDKNLDTDGSDLNDLVRTAKDGQVTIRKALYAEEGLGDHKHQTRVLMEVRFTVERNAGARERFYD